jgi:hypothetical protein
MFNINIYKNLKYTVKKLTLIWLQIYYYPSYLLWIMHHIWIICLISVILQNYILFGVILTLDYYASVYMMPTTKNMTDTKKYDGCQNICQYQVLLGVIYFIMISSLNWSLLALGSRQSPSVFSHMLKAKVKPGFNDLRRNIFMYFLYFVLLLSHVSYLFISL